MKKKMLRGEIEEKHEEQKEEEEEANPADTSI